MLSASMVTLTLPTASPMIGGVVGVGSVGAGSVGAGWVGAGSVGAGSVGGGGSVLVANGVSTTLSRRASAPPSGRPTSLMVSPEFNATLLMVKLLNSLPSGNL
jgi:hypothetical protein